jgi:hypothetical protein
MALGRPAAGLATSRPQQVAPIRSRRGVTQADAASGIDTAARLADAAAFLARIQLKLEKGMAAPSSSRWAGALSDPPALLLELTLCP